MSELYRCYTGLKVGAHSLESKSFLVFRFASTFAHCRCALMFLPLAPSARSPRLQVEVSCQQFHRNHFMMEVDGTNWQQGWVAALHPALFIHPWHWLLCVFVWLIIMDLFSNRFFFLLSLWSPELESNTFGDSVQFSLRTRVWLFGPLSKVDFFHQC